MDVGKETASSVKNIVSKASVLLPLFAINV
jgi:hypothetical protein